MIVKVYGGLQDSPGLVNGLFIHNETVPDSKVHVTNMGPTWVLLAPDWPHVGPMNLAIRDDGLAIDCLPMMSPWWAYYGLSAHCEECTDHDLPWHVCGHPFPLCPPVWACCHHWPHISPVDWWVPHQTGSGCCFVMLTRVHTYSQYGVSTPLSFNDWQSIIQCSDGTGYTCVITQSVGEWYCMEILIAVAL